MDKKLGLGALISLVIGSMVGAGSSVCHKTLLRMPVPGRSPWVGPSPVLA